jgi:hypothetical protein
MVEHAGVVGYFGDGWPRALDRKAEAGVRLIYDFDGMLYYGYKYCLSLAEHADDASLCTVLIDCGSGESEHSFGAGGGGALVGLVSLRHSVSRQRGPGPSGPRTI